MTPVPLSRPSVPRSVTRLAALEGPYSESPVCDPMAPAARLAASALAEPPLDAIADFDGLNPFQTYPHASLEKLPFVAYSSRAAFPKIPAPDSRNFGTWKASRAVLKPA